MGVCCTCCLWNPDQGQRSEGRLKHKENISISLQMRSVIWGCFFYIPFSLLKLRPVILFLLFTSPDSSFHNKHEEALQQFSCRMRKEICVNDNRLVGYVKETYSALGEKFLKDLLTYCKSVGIIMNKHADGSQRRTGTVFRVGSHFVLTNYHVVQSIAGQWLNLIKDWWYVTSVIG